MSIAFRKITLMRSRNATPQRIETTIFLKIKKITIPKSVEANNAKKQKSNARNK